MNRNDALQWLEQHRHLVHGDPQEIIDRCERAVRRHAVEDAWLAAKAYVESRRHEWEHEWGMPASAAFVAREICRQLAWELGQHEPHVQPGDAPHLAGGTVQRALEPEAWDQLCAWILELAESAEHRAWQEIVRFTGRHGGQLAREHHLSNDSDWSPESTWAAHAARVAALIEREFSQHAYPHRS